MSYEKDLIEFFENGKKSSEYALLGIIPLTHSFTYRLNNSSIEVKVNFFNAVNKIGEKGILCMSDHDDYLFFIDELSTILDVCAEDRLTIKNYKLHVLKPVLKIEEVLKCAEVLTHV